MHRSCPLLLAIQHTEMTHHQNPSKLNKLKLTILSETTKQCTNVSMHRTNELIELMNKD